MENLEELHEGQRNFEDLSEDGNTILTTEFEIRYAGAEWIQVAWRREDWKLLLKHNLSILVP